MADYILIRKGRNALSTATHVILNLLLGVGSIVLTVVTGHWLIGILLVFLSKWRMFAVRRRYWWSSLKANLVDLTAGVSFVLLAYLTGSTWTLAHTLLAIGYTVWLIWIKPKSTPVFTEAQALIALFLGSAVISLIFATLDAVWPALLTFVLASACARHVMSQRDDTNFTLSTLCVGLFGAEAMWLAHTWYIIYVFGDTGIRIPQISLILTLGGFLLSRIYHSTLKHDGKFKPEEIAAPVLFAAATILIIFLFFSQPVFDI